MIVDLDNYISFSDLAKKWGVNTSLIYQYVNKGRLQGAIKIGGKLYLPNNVKRPPDRRFKMLKEPLDIQI